MYNRIKVNNKIENINYILKENDIINVNITDFNTNSFSDKFKIIDLPFNILYEDDYLLIVDKGPNMPIHPSSDNYENTLSNIVAFYLKKQNINNIHIITRLDKNTSGICIFAKNEYIQELFVRKKDDINLVKKYICIVNGILEKDHDFITYPIARKPNSIILRQVNEDGNFAKTEYNVISRNIKNNYTVVEVTLHTGRTHQIRVHMGYIGHTLLGDDLYAKEYGVDDITKYISRQALHCYNITFNHPITNEKINIVSPLPNDMKNLI